MDATATKVVAAEILDCFSILDDGHIAQFVDALFNHDAEELQRLLAVFSSCYAED